MTSPGLACALRAAATGAGLGALRGHVLGRRHQPGDHRQPDDDDPDLRVEQRGRAQRDEEEEGQEDHRPRSARRTRSR